MLSHDRVWAAIDALAERYSLSASGLAKRAGLDSTAFNKSKRQSSDGRPRWPSTESVAKIIEATNSSLDEFLSLVEGKPSGDRPLPVQPSTVPLLGFAQAGAGGFFDDAGFPAGQGWDLIELPAQSGEGSYALQVQGDSMLPLYRHGDVLVVQPHAAVRKGDRVVVKTSSGEVMAKVLQRRTASIIDLVSLNPEHPDRRLDAAEVEWLARIVWASQ
ncbi:MAG: helix-turn-helix transcriptional regulator [Alphaproteobacteria bacterium]|jgi:phage repressor protein C with HTH and peptisase S24 domain|nr:helix-turn-helix transcriptional regulator [Alphaproteobacteria bacterium]MBU0803606.1 helix-turn-helix transcriptional regulator [Alphaproteobacteria bacterium]MBU0873097.1 helix-turn-helix transcriptional regulator [Alphaproteobacteria bacterium]MBU1402533.1 helix-turn-helix transcriptional regulator [Alphaproteobacteria bacterium]MBU1593175.1 helix-turn-helix transcriptional regulator [Alphaproteobacteria bacterium]